MTRDFPDNPFVPGFGELPPVMGRRPKVDQELDDVARRLAQPERPGPRALFLYGPRGTGKTVHIRDFQARLRRSRTPVTMIDLSARMVKTPVAMERALFTPDIEVAGGGLADGAPVTRREEMVARLKDWVRTFQSSDSVLAQHVQKMRPKDARLWAGLGYISLEPPDQPDISSGRSLQRLGSPLLITLDEAHKVEPAALGHLLDAVQDAGAVMPVVLMLGGTPDLIDQLANSESSFFVRGMRLQTGRLDPTASRHVIEQPFQDAGLLQDPKALDYLLQAADNYPWFLQLYGREAYRAVEKSGGRRLGMDACRIAMEQARVPRERYYEMLRREFRAAPQREIARTVARAFQARSGVMRAIDIENLLDAIDANQAIAMERHMRHAGFIVEGRKPGTWEPGIPSFMDYMIQATEPDESQLPPSDPKDGFKP